jgi:hypothetical protein
MGGHKLKSPMKQNLRPLGSGLQHFFFQRPRFEGRMYNLALKAQVASKTFTELIMLFSHCGLQFLIAVFKDMQQIKLQRKFAKEKVVLDPREPRA